MEDGSSKVKTKKSNQSDLYLHIKTVTSDSFDKKDCDFIESTLGFNSFA